MTIEMMRFYFMLASPEVTSVCGVSAVAILHSGFSKLCMSVVGKKVDYAGLLCCREL